MGVNNLIEVFNEGYYTNLSGGILEAFGKLFRREVTIYLYPYQTPDSEEILTSENLKVNENLKELYKFFSQIYTNGLRRKGILYDIWLSICLLEDLAGIKVSTPIRMISPEIFIYMEDYYSFLIKYINEDCEVELKSIIDPKMRVHCKPGIEDSILEVINIVKS